MLRRVALIALTSLALTAQAPPPERPPVSHAQLVDDLAFVLGQSHGLRQLCNGEADQYWRDRMEALLQLEAADEAAREPLVRRFNDGYRDSRSRQLKCGTYSRQAERGVAAHGKALADAVVKVR